MQLLRTAYIKFQWWASRVDQYYVMLDALRLLSGDKERESE